MVVTVADIQAESPPDTVPPFASPHQPSTARRRMIAFSAQIAWKSALILVSAAQRAQ